MIIVNSRQPINDSLSADIKVFRGDTLSEIVTWGSQGAAIIDSGTGLPVLDAEGHPTYQFVPTDWTGFTGQAQIRETADAEDILVSLTVTLGANGTIAIFGDKNLMASLPADELFYDVQIDSAGGIRKTYLFGRFITLQDVTR